MSTETLEQENVRLKTEALDAMKEWADAERLLKADIAALRAGAAGLRIETIRLRSKLESIKHIAMGDV